MSAPIALDAAREAAQAVLEQLDLPAMEAKAIAGAMHLGEHIIDLVAETYRSRAANPKAWHAFHSTMARALPRWRWLARAHHRRMARRYAAMVAAGTAIPCSKG